MSACKKIEVNNIGVLTNSRTFIQPSLKSVPLININDVDYLSRVERDQNLHTFVIIPSTLEHLETAVTKLERTTWWNPSALYVILDDNVPRNGCRNARPFLKTAWKKDLLSSIIPLYHRTPRRNRNIHNVHVQSVYPASTKILAENERMERDKRSSLDPVYPNISSWFVKEQSSTPTHLIV